MVHPELARVLDGRVVTASPRGAVRLERTLRTLEQLHRGDALVSNVDATRVLDTLVVEVRPQADLEYRLLDELAERLSTDQQRRQEHHPGGDEDADGRLEEHTDRPREDRKQRKPSSGGGDGQLERGRQDRDRLTGDDPDEPRAVRTCDHRPVGSAEHRRPRHDVAEDDPCHPHPTSSASAIFR